MRGRCQEFGDGYWTEFSTLVEDLDLGTYFNFGDEGIAYLAQGVQASSRIKLTTLRLVDVGWGDADLEALAEVIRTGALMECPYCVLLKLIPFKQSSPWRML